MEEDLKNALDVLRKGGIILYPTDTIWGIGCDATNEVSVKKIYDLKKRADNKAMLVLVDSFSKVERYVSDVPEIAESLEDVSVKPLTIIYDNTVGLADNLLGDNRSVGIRVSKERFSKELCRRFGRPIVSTSANISGHPSAANYAQIDKEIINGVDYVVKFRQNDESEHQASSIVKLSFDGTIKILRD